MITKLHYIDISHKINTNGNKIITVRAWLKIQKESKFKISETSLMSKISNTLYVSMPRRSPRLDIEMISRYLGVVPVMEILNQNKDYLVFDDIYKMREAYNKLKELL